MNYYAKGKIYEKGPIAEGTSAQGNKWQRMTVVIEVPVGQYSKKVAMNVMTGNIHDVMSFNIGDSVEVAFDISSREYTNQQGVKSWFTSADLREIKPAGMKAEPQPIPSTPIPGPGEPQDDDLPFGNE